MQIDRRYLIHGFLPAFFSACCFAVMAVCIKIASSELPAVQLVFLRSIIGLLIILPIVLPRGINYIKTPVLHLHMLRGLISHLCHDLFLSMPFPHVGLSESTLLNASSPLFIGLLAMPILKEKITTRSAIALVVGFIGVCFILKPGTDLIYLRRLDRSMFWIIYCLCKNISPLYGEHRTRHAHRVLLQYFFNDLFKRIDDLVLANAIPV